jgi:hypothetical protein
MTGMRSWIGCISELHPVVMMQQLSIDSPLSVIQVSHMPAKENGVPSRLDIK